jgi:hypothetical protein
VSTNLDLRAIAFAAACVFAVGCGSSHSSARPSGGATPDGVTKAKAFAYAQGVNLRPADVPSMNAFAGETTGGSVVRFELTPKRGCGAVDRGESFDTLSPVFSTGRGYPERLPAEGLHSRVSVVSSAAEQTRDFSARVCDGTRNAKSERLPSPLPGVRVFARRMRDTAPSYMFRSARVTLYRDRFSIIVGPAEVVLAVMSAPRPPRADLERRLLSLLYRRAKAHPL